MVHDVTPVDGEALAKAREHFQVMQEIGFWESLYPDVKVQLSGTDGNAFAILARVRKALRQAGHGEVVEEFTQEATSGDYDHLLLTCCRYVEVS